MAAELLVFIRYYQNDQNVVLTMMSTKTMMMLIDADSAIYCTQRDSLIASLHLRAPIFYFLLIFQFAEYDTIRYTLFTCAKKLDG